MNSSAHTFANSVALLLCGCCLAAAAPAAKPKSEAYKAYEAQAGMLATTTIQSQLAGSLERLLGRSFKVTFQVDPGGGVHNLNVVLSKPDQSAREIARRAVSNLKLPRFSKTLLAEQGQTPVDVVATFEVRSARTRDKTTKRDSPDTRAYLLKIDAAIYGTFAIEVANHRGPIEGTVTITLLLDAAGHVRDQAIHSTSADPWLRVTAAKVIRATRMPTMPKKVIAEHEGGLVAFQTELVYHKVD